MAPQNHVCLSLPPMSVGSTGTPSAHVPCAWFWDIEGRGPVSLAALCTNKMSESKNNFYMSERQQGLPYDDLDHKNACFFASALQISHKFLLRPTLTQSPIGKGILENVVLAKLS